MLTATTTAAATREPMVGGMEEVLLDSFEDVCMHRAYASLLMQSREAAWMARARFIEASLKLEEPDVSPEERRKLESRKRKLLADHGRTWLGARLADYLLDREKGYRFVLERGWLVEVQAPGLDAGFLAALARAPQARMLRRLVIGCCDEAPAPDALKALEPLREATFSDRLQELQVGSRGAGEAPAALLDRLLLS